MEVDRLAPTFSSHAVHVSLPRVVAPYSSISWSLFFSNLVQLRGGHAGEDLRGEIVVVRRVACTMPRVTREQRSLGDHQLVARRHLEQARDPLRAHAAGVGRGETDAGPQLRTALGRKRLDRSSRGDRDRLPRRTTARGRRRRRNVRGRPDWPPPSRASASAARPDLS